VSLRVVVQAATHLVRQPIAQSLSALGLAVREFADLAEMVARLNELSPELIVMDADGMARPWRTLAAGLGSARSGVEPRPRGGVEPRPRGGVGLVLLASRFSFADAHDAQALGVAGVIMKPYRREEHAVRLLDIALARKGLRPRRAAPRTSLPEGEEAWFELSLPTGDERLPVNNIAEGGVAVGVVTTAANAALVEGENFPAATLVWGSLRLELSFVVAHTTAGTAGLRFIQVVEGWPRRARALEERFARAVGPLERKRRW
jgi:DNA-binding NarL/FixJ family response regulator